MHNVRPFRYFVKDSCLMRLIARPEMELLLLCARMEVSEDRAQRIRDLLRCPIDWGDLVFSGVRHGLIPLLYRTLSGLSSNEVAPHIMERLRALFEIYRLRNRLFVRELLSVLRILNAGEIVAIPYKGPALAAALFKDYSLRQSGDIDILVRKRDALRARSLLIGEGYRACFPNVHLWGPTQAAYVRAHSTFVLRDPLDQVSIDLNWRVAPWYFRFPEIPESAWDRLQGISLADETVRWFAPEDLLFVLCLHGSKHKWEALKWVVDIAELVRCHPDLNWDEVSDRARRTGSQRMLGVGLFLAANLLGAPLPRAATNAVQRTPAVESLAAEVCDHVFLTNPRGIDTIASLRFMARTTERLGTKFSCRALLVPYYVVHRILRPGLAAVRRFAVHRGSVGAPLY